MHAGRQVHNRVTCDSKQTLSSMSKFHWNLQNIQQNHITNHIVFQFTKNRWQVFLILEVITTELQYILLHSTIKINRFTFCYFGIKIPGFQPPIKVTIITSGCVFFVVTVRQLCFALFKSTSKVIIWHLWWTDSTNWFEDDFDEYITISGV